MLIHNAGGGVGLAALDIANVDRSFTFDRAGDAHTYIEERKNIGKVVLVP